MKAKRIKVVSVVGTIVAFFLVVASIVSQRKDMHNGSSRGLAANTADSHLVHRRADEKGLSALAAEQRADAVEGTQGPEQLGRTLLTVHALTESENNDELLTAYARWEKHDLSKANQWGSPDSYIAEATGRPPEIAIPGNVLRCSVWVESGSLGTPPLTVGGLRHIEGKWQHPSKNIKKEVRIPAFDRESCATRWGYITVDEEARVPEALSVKCICRLAGGKVDEVYPVIDRGAAKYSMVLPPDYTPLSIYAEAPGVVSFGEDLSESVDSRCDIDLLSGTILGVTLLEDSGQPIPNREVIARYTVITEHNQQRRMKKGILRTLSTNDEGFVVFAGMPFSSAVSVGIRPSSEAPAIRFVEEVITSGVLEDPKHITVRLAAEGRRRIDTSQLWGFLPYNIDQIGLEKDELAHPVSAVFEDDGRLSRRHCSVHKGRWTITLPADVEAELALQPLEATAWASMSVRTPPPGEELGPLDFEPANGEMVDIGSLRGVLCPDTGLSASFYVAGRFEPVQGLEKLSLLLLPANKGLRLKVAIDGRATTEWFVDAGRENAVSLNGSIAGASCVCLGVRMPSGLSKRNVTIFLLRHPHARFESKTTLVCKADLDAGEHSLNVLLSEGMYFVGCLPSSEEGLCWTILEVGSPSGDSDYQVAFEGEWTDRTRFSGHSALVLDEWGGRSLVGWVPERLRTLRWSKDQADLLFVGDLSQAVYRLLD